MSENTSPDASPELIERYRQRARELHENATRIEDELRTVEEKKAELQTTLARIRGAVQVLEEIIDEKTR
jgi:HPt (histidine-containing phosphotransfer) domain-containing protein